MIAHTKEYYFHLPVHLLQRGVHLVTEEHGGIARLSVLQQVDFPVKAQNPDMQGRWRGKVRNQILASLIIGAAKLLV